MIFKYPNGSPFELYFVTKELLNALDVQAVPFNGLGKIHEQHDKLTYDEVANWIALQYAAAELFGVDMPQPETLFGEGYAGGMVAQAFNEINSKSIVEFIKNSTSFSSTKIGQVLIVGIDVDGSPKVSDWEKLKGKNISTAVQETIYERVGYLNSHFGLAPKSALGVLTLAEVYRLIQIQNS